MSLPVYLVCDRIVSSSQNRQDRIDDDQIGRIESPYLTGLIELLQRLQQFARWTGMKLFEQPTVRVYQLYDLSGIDLPRFLTGQFFERLLQFIQRLGLVVLAPGQLRQAP